MTTLYLLAWALTQLAQVAEPATATIQVELIRNMAAILTAMGATLAGIGSVIGVILAYRNGKKTDAVAVQTKAVADQTQKVADHTEQVAVQAADAATKAETANTRLQDVHDLSTKVAAQTDGQLTALRNDNKELQAMLRQALAALSGTRVAAAIAEGKPVPVSPIRDGQSPVTTHSNGDAIQQMNRRHGDRRRDASQSDDHKDE